jgi:hypothetical protein
VASSLTISTVHYLRPKKSVKCLKSLIRLNRRKEQVQTLTCILPVILAAPRRDGYERDTSLGQVCEKRSVATSRWCVITEPLWTRLKAIVRSSDDVVGGDVFFR